MPRILLLFLLVQLILGCASKRSESEGKTTGAGFDFQNGDLVFQDLDCGELCDAIEKVTPAWRGKHLSHVGIVEVVDTHVVVIEAIGEEVRKTSLQHFLDRNRDENGQPKVLVGRVDREHRHLVDKAVAFCNTQLGVPYDEAFLPDNGKYYCSELLYDAFRVANNGQEVFIQSPMTFRDPATEGFFPAWIAYYEALHMPVPEGFPGCNPGSIVNDERVEVVAVLY